MKPLIKWPGGKSAEIGQFQMLLPQEYDRYVEPFVGGGALYFHMQPEKAVLGDVSENLMSFYRLTGQGDKSFRGWLERYDAAFTALRHAVEAETARLMDLFELYDHARRAHIQAAPLHLCAGMVAEVLKDEAFSEANEDLVFDRDQFREIMVDSVENKYLRTVANHGKSTFSVTDLQVIAQRNGYFFKLHQIDSVNLLLTVYFQPALFILQWIISSEIIILHVLEILGFSVPGKSDSCPDFRSRPVCRFCIGNICGFRACEDPAKQHQQTGQATGKYLFQSVRSFRRVRYCCTAFVDIISNRACLSMKFMVLFSVVPVLTTRPDHG